MKTCPSCRQFRCRQCQHPLPKLFVAALTFTHQGQTSLVRANGEPKLIWCVGAFTGCAITWSESMANEIHMFLAHFYADETPVETALTILDAQVPVCLLSFRRLRPLPCCQRSERLINFVQLDGLWNVADEDILHPPDRCIGRVFFQVRSGRPRCNLSNRSRAAK